MQRFGNVGSGDLLDLGEVSNGAGQLDDAVVGARGERHLADGGAEQGFRRVIQGRELAHLFRPHVRVRQGRRSGEAAGLSLAGALHPLTNCGGTPACAPLGALRDFADALDQSDSNRVMAAMQLELPAARRIGIAMGEAVAAERDFKRAVAARFGNRPVRIINLNFGQSAFKTGADLSDTVTYTDADHVIIRLPSRSRPDKPHSVQLVRVKGVWKFSDKETLGMDDGEDETLAVFRKTTAMMKEIEGEISEGKYQSYDEAVRALAKRFRTL